MKYVKTGPNNIHVVTQANSMIFTRFHSHFPSFSIAYSMYNLEWVSYSAQTLSCLHITYTYISYFMYDCCMIVGSGARIAFFYFKILNVTRIPRISHYFYYSILSWISKVDIKFLDFDILVLSIHFSEIIINIIAIHMCYNSIPIYRFYTVHQSTNWMKFHISLLSNLVFSILHNAMYNNV